MQRNFDAQLGPASAALASTSPHFFTLERNIRAEASKIAVDA